MNIAQLNIELSSRCDRATLCGFCGHQDRKVNPNLKFGDMDLSMVWSISRQIELGTIVSFHRDGDPLVYPHLGEALECFEGHPTSIVTHGESLGSRAAEIIGRVTTITVSVIPNDKDRELQLASITEFLAKKGDKAPQVQLKMVGAVENQEDYLSLGVPVIGRSLHNKKGNWTYQREPIVPEIRVCLDFLHRPTIDWRGRVFVCNRLDTTDAGLIGDLNENTLEEVWNGSRRRQMLEAHLSGHRERANSLCASCKFWGIPTD